MLEDQTRTWAYCCELVEELVTEQKAEEARALCCPLAHRLVYESTRLVLHMFIFMITVLCSVYMVLPENTATVFKFTQHCQKGQIIIFVVNTNDASFLIFIINYFVRLHSVNLAVQCYSMLKSQLIYLTSM